jgi:hypothetical protein
MRAQVEHAEATANQAQAADGALDEIVGAIQTISDTAVRIADVTAQQSGAVSEIRDHSERIHRLGEDNLLRIGEGRARASTCWYWAGNCIPPCRPSASDPRSDLGRSQPPLPMTGSNTQSQISRKHRSSCWLLQRTGQS